MKLLFIIFIIAMTAPAVLFYLAAVVYMFRKMVREMFGPRQPKKSMLVSQFIS